MSGKKKYNLWKKRTAAIAAAFTFLFTGMGIFSGCGGNDTISSTVSLEVNPGVEIKVNEKDVVLEVGSLNSEGAAVVENMDLKGKELDAAVKELVDFMVKKDYINEQMNSVLISVSGDSAEKSKELKEHLAKEVDTILKNSNLEGAVVSQTVTADTETKKIANDYGISVGKAQLVKRIAAQNTAYTHEDLAKLSINELSLLSENASGTTEGIYR